VEKLQDAEKSDGKSTVWLQEAHSRYLKNYTLKEAMLFFLSDDFKF
jgi:hypothetical protein